MADIELDELNTKKLLQDAARFSYGTKPPKQPRNKKRIQRQAEPHLAPIKVKGKTYWVYRRGIDPPIYLGDADTILGWKYKIKKGKRQT